VLFVAPNPILTPGCTVDVYVFDRAITCAQIDKTTYGGGWALNTSINGTKYVEISFNGPHTGTFPYSSVAARCPAGTANTIYSVQGAPPATADTLSTGGSVTLTAYTAGSHIAGTFDVQFGTTGNLKGSFDTMTFCPNGGEP
jgi:hypothetical protein